MNTLLVASSTNIELYNKTLEACLRTVSGFSEQTIYNICTGQVNIVPLGFWDYVMTVGLALLGLVFIFMFIKILLD